MACHNLRRGKPEGQDIKVLNMEKSYTFKLFLLGSLSNVGYVGRFV